MCSSVFICPLAFQSKIVKDVHCTVLINYCHSCVCYSMMLSNVIVITLVKTRMDDYDHDDDADDDDDVFV